MTDQLNRFGMGARFIPADALTEVDLGPLKQLIGQWENVPLTNSGQPLASGWNVISVPGVDKGFVYEVIPYSEHLKFSAVAVQAGNRGPVVNGQQEDQEIFGLFYEQEIKSLCDTPFCNQRGFQKGTVIHAETGLFLYIKNFNGGFNIARLGTVPHGNSLLTMGASSEETNPGTDFFPVASAKGVNLNGSPIGRLGYNDQITGERQFKIFDQVDPNAFLQFSLKQILGESGTITNMTTLPMSSNNPKAPGGILNIPFIQANVTATTMNAIFWLENRSANKEDDLLQYTQTINLVFPPTGETTPIVWPHITINTMKRMSEALPKSAALTDASQEGTFSEGVPQL